MNTVEVVDLSKSFNGKVVVNIPKMSIRKGEIVGLVGNNGAGKTTLLRLVLDLLEPDKGSVLINDLNVHDNETWKKNTGSFIDSGFLIEYLTPDEFFKFIAGVYNINESELSDRLSLFDKFMNDEILNQSKFIRNFSSGNKQKIGIISAMIIYPNLLVLDEPFNYLDPTSQITIKNIIKQLNNDFGTTVLISSHNLDHITEISSKIFLLKNGIIEKELLNEDSKAYEVLKDYFAI